MGQHLSRTASNGQSVPEPQKVLQKSMGDITEALSFVLLMLLSFPIKPDTLQFVLTLSHCKPIIMLL